LGQPPTGIRSRFPPRRGEVKAEVWVTNEDAGWVEVNQAVKIKLAAFPFNKYGMVSGRVEYVSPDAAELPDTRERDRKDTREHVMPPSGFRALVALDSPYLERDGKRYRVSAGMLVSAEVNLGSRTVWSISCLQCRMSRTKRGGRCELQNVRVKQKPGPGAEVL